MKTLVAGVAVLLFALPGAATGEVRVRTAAPLAVPKTVLAIEESRRGDVLVRLDGRTLRPRSKRVRLGGAASYGAWSFSPKGRRVAVGIYGLRGFRIFDVGRLKNVGQVQTWSETISMLAWLAPRRIIGLEQAGLFAVDPVTRKHLPAPPEVTGEVQTVRRVGDVLVLVVAPRLEIGLARVAVLDGQGNVRTVQLEGIKAGVRWEWGTMRGERYRPGLAVDPTGRAFVVGVGNDAVAEVDLKTLAVTYHRPQTHRSVLTRFHNWVEPAAEAKMLAGSFRRALWLGDGRIAVWGYDSTPTGAERVKTSLAGLSIIDTRDGTRRLIDSQAGQAAFAAGTLLSTTEGTGLTAYSSDGQRRYRIFDGETVWIAATYGSRAFITSRNSPIYVVDVASGRLLGTRRDVPRVLHQSFRNVNDA